MINNANEVHPIDGRKMSKNFRDEGYEWIDRPNIPDKDIVRDFSNDSVIADNGKYILQYNTMTREDFSFTFKWDGNSLNLFVGVVRSAGQPFPFFVDYAFFKDGEDFRFDTTQELKRIFSIIAVCLEKYSGSEGPNYFWPKFKHSVRISMPQGYRRLISEKCPERTGFSWRAIL